MNSGNSNGPIGLAAAEEMARIGIVVVPIHRYHFKTYRYTNMEDALAEARRDDQRARQRSAPPPQSVDNITNVGSIVT